MNGVPGYLALLIRDECEDARHQKAGRKNQSLQNGQGAGNAFEAREAKEDNAGDQSGSHRRFDDPESVLEDEMVRYGIADPERRKGNDRADEGEGAVEQS